MNAPRSRVGGWEGAVKHILGMIFVLAAATRAWASDGPQNTGVLTLAKGDGVTLEGQLQIDRAAFDAVMGAGQDVTKDAVARLVEIRHGAAACRLDDVVPVASDAVANAALTYACDEAPFTVVTRLVAPERLPEGFSLGVLSPGGHVSLDRATPEAPAIVSLNYLYGKAGLAYFGGGDTPDQVDMGRPAAMWFGGTQRLPRGVGFLLVLLAMVLLATSRAQRTFLPVAAWLGASVAAYVVLSQKWTQDVHAFLYVPHVTLVLNMAAFALVFARSGTARGAGLTLALLGALTYGLEMAPVLWKLESLKADALPGAVGSFAMGVLAPLVVGLALGFALAACLGLGKERAGPTRRARAVMAAAGMAACAYLLACLVVRIHV